MPLLPSPPKDKPFREKPLPQAHFLEWHFVHRKLDWAAAAKLLADMFPRDTRPERPSAWYRLLAGTHWVGDVPPGNGPFYVPEWVFLKLDDKVAEAMKARLRKSGFQEVTAHVVVLPQTSEYLATAMRVAGSVPWNADPISYRAYLYPALGKWKRPLRDPFTTERWRV